jgi:hypothetical protein
VGGRKEEREGGRGEGREGGKEGRKKKRREGRERRREGGRKAKHFSPPTKTTSCLAGFGVLPHCRSSHTPSLLLLVNFPAPPPSALFDSGSIWQCSTHWSWNGEGH